MTGLPTGTVSLLFSDVEGSTRLLARLGSAYADVLDGQRSVLRNAWTRHRGTELGTEGDSFFVVFPTAALAAAAAVQAQRDLARLDWPAGERVRVRMGVHTGTPEPHGDAYVGMDVHRAARIAAAAHGGQVVLSEATARLARDTLPDGVALHRLGRYRLKDLPEDEHLFELRIAGLESDFPALRSLGAVTGLPRESNRLVGRNADIAELTELLSSGVARLLTLTGQGGAGKTRLAAAVAAAVADAYADGIYFVPLSSVPTGEAMWGRLREVVGPPPDVQTPQDLCAHLAGLETLLVLDNVEQIPDAEEVVDQLLDVAPDLRIIATSRRVLQLAASQHYPVQPLSVPADPLDALITEFGAVQLFVQQARRVRPSFELTAANAPAVVELCSQLDGLPLAIELLAAQTRLLTPQALLSRLDRVLDITTPDRRAHRRHRTLRDTIAWSYGALDPVEQAVLRSCAVFAGGAGLEAFTSVVQSALGPADPYDVMAALADASTITVAEGVDGEPRVLLAETTRAFALQELQRLGEREQVRALHARYYGGLVGHLARQRLSGRADVLLTSRARFEAEAGNVREALRWALEDGTTAVDTDRRRFGVELCVDLHYLWLGSGLASEEERWLELAVTHIPDATTPGDAVCLSLYALAALRAGKNARAYEAAAEAVATARSTGHVPDLIRTLETFGVIATEVGERGVARSAFDEAVTLAEPVDRNALADVLWALAILEEADGNLPRALELCEQVVAIKADLADDYGVLLMRGNIAELLREAKRLPEAHQLCLELAPRYVEMAEPRFVLGIAETLAAVLAERGELDHVPLLVSAADALRRRLRERRESGWDEDIGAVFEEARGRVPEERWRSEAELGARLGLHEALRRACAGHPPPCASAPTVTGTTAARLARASSSAPVRDEPRPAS